MVTSIRVPLYLIRPFETVSEPGDIWPSLEGPTLEVPGEIHVHGPSQLLELFELLLRIPLVSEDIDPTDHRYQIDLKELRFEAVRLKNNDGGDLSVDGVGHKVVHMRIVEVNPFHYPFLGGIEHRVHHISKRLAKRA